MGTLRRGLVGLATQPRNGRSFRRHPRGFCRVRPSDAESTPVRIPCGGGLGRFLVGEVLRAVFLHPWKTADA